MQNKILITKDALRMDYLSCYGGKYWKTHNIDELANKPIYEYIVKVVEAIGSILKKNDLVILRSTISVGTTKNKVLPILEKMSGLKGGRDFNLWKECDRRCF